MGFGDRKEVLYYVADKSSIGIADSWYRGDSATDEDDCIAKVKSGNYKVLFMDTLDGNWKRVYQRAIDANPNIRFIGVAGRPETGQGQNATTLEMQSTFGDLGVATPKYVSGQTSFFSNAIITTMQSFLGTGDRKAPQSVMARG